MIKYSVCFQNTDEVAEFVKLANHLNCDVDLVSGNRMVDGKSLLGAIAISEASGLYTVIHSDFCKNADGLLSEMKAFSRDKNFVA